MMCRRFTTLSWVISTEPCPSQTTSQRNRSVVDLSESTTFVTRGQATSMEAADLAAHGVMSRASLNVLGPSLRNRACLPTAVGISTADELIFRSSSGAGTKVGRSDDRSQISTVLLWQPKFSVARIEAIQILCTRITIGFTSRSNGQSRVSYKQRRRSATGRLPTGGSAVARTHYPSLTQVLPLPESSCSLMYADRLLWPLQPGVRIGLRWEYPAICRSLSHWRLLPEAVVPAFRMNSSVVGHR